MLIYNRCDSINIVQNFGDQCAQPSDDDLESIVLDHSPAAITLAGTWLSPSVTDFETSSEIHGFPV